MGTAGPKDRAYETRSVGHVLSDVPAGLLRSGLEVLHDLCVLGVVGVQHVRAGRLGGRAEDVRWRIAILEFSTNDLRRLQAARSLIEAAIGETQSSECKQLSIP